MKNIEKRHIYAFYVVFIMFLIGVFLWYLDWNYFYPRLLLYIPFFIIGMIFLIPILINSLKEDYNAN
jgi:hypothetical protein